MGMCEIAWDFRPLNFDEQQNTEIVLMGIGRGILKKTQMPRVAPRLPLAAFSERIKHVKERPPGRGRGRGRNWQQQKEILERTVGKYPDHDHNTEVSSKKLEAQGLQPSTTLPVLRASCLRMDDDLTNIGSSKIVDETGCFRTEKRSIADNSSSLECNENDHKEKLKDVDTNANDSCKDENSDCYLDADSDESFLTENVKVSLTIGDANSNTNHIAQKKKKNKQFDFAKSHETMMKELAMLELPKKTRRLATLSKSNLEKHHKMFNVGNDGYRQDGSNCSQSNDDFMPLYEKYAVTLDDIWATARCQVPCKVKENMCCFQNSVNNDFTIPKEHFDNNANGHEDSGSIDRFNSKFDDNGADESINTNIKQVKNVTEENVCLEVGVAVSAMQPDEKISAELLDALEKNCSMQLFGLLDSSSDLSNFVKCDVSNSDNRIDECLVQSSGEHEIEFKAITNNECDSNILEQFSTVIAEDDCNLHDRVTQEELETILKDTANGKRSCKDMSTKECSNMLHADDLDEIDLYDTKHAVVAIEEIIVSDDEEFVSKRNKRHTMTPTKDVKMFERTTKDPFWRVSGQNVIQIDGLPSKLKDMQQQLHDIICGFGSVLDEQMKHVDGHTSVRYKLNTADACAFAIECLHDTECPFSDDDKTLTCFKLEE